VSAAAVATSSAERSSSRHTAIARLMSLRPTPLAVLADGDALDLGLASALAGDELQMADHRRAVPGHQNSIQVPVTLHLLERVVGQSEQICQRRARPSNH
jgi:hypothetical protein